MWENQVIEFYIVITDNLIEYYVFLKIPLKIDTLKKYKNINTLWEILEILNTKKKVFLDIKDTSITRNDILCIFKEKKFEEVILWNKSVRFLNRFNDMPEMFKKIMNWNIFCNYYDFDYLKSRNYKYFEVVFWFQISNRLIERLNESGLILRISGIWFRSIKNYYKIIEKYNITHISSDFIRTS